MTNALNAAEELCNDERDLYRDLVHFIDIHCESWDVEEPFLPHRHSASASCTIEDAMREDL